MEVAWLGDEWQERCELLFVRHHGAGNYQHVPDRDRGDLGIEGFSLDEKAHCYQCFATEHTEVGARYEAQRNKMSEDLGKLVKNKDRVGKLLGKQKLRRWIFVVPEHDSKRLIAHARKKEEELKAAGLDFLAEDFKVVIHTEKEYAVEAAMVDREGLASIGVLTEEVTPAALTKLEQDDTERVKIMDAKLARVTPDPAELRAIMLRSAVDGGNIRNYLHREHPMTDELVSEQIALEERAVLLERETGELHRGSLRPVQARMAKRLAEKVTALREPNSERLSYGVIANWLMECPLDFPEAGE